MTTALLIFDMDGTLVDSEFCAAQTMCDVLPGLNLSPDEIVSTYRGVKLAVTISELVRRYELVVPDDIINIYPIYFAQWPNSEKSLSESGHGRKFSNC